MQIHTVAATALPSSAGFLAFGCPWPVYPRACFSRSLRGCTCGHVCVCKVMPLALSLFKIDFGGVRRPDGASRRCRRFFGGQGCIRQYRAPRHSLLQERPTQLVSQFREIRVSFHPHLASVRLLDRSSSSSFRGFRASVARDRHHPKSWKGSSSYVMNGPRGLYDFSVTRAAINTLLL